MKGRKEGRPTESRTQGSQVSRASFVKVDILPYRRLLVDRLASSYFSGPLFLPATQEYKASPLNQDSSHSAMEKPHQRHISPDMMAPPPEYDLWELHLRACICKTRCVIFTSRYPLSDDQNIEITSPSLLGPVPRWSAAIYLDLPRPALLPMIPERKASRLNQDRVMTHSTMKTSPNPCAVLHDGPTTTPRV